MRALQQDKKQRLLSNPRSTYSHLCRQIPEIRLPFT